MTNPTAAGAPQGGVEAGSLKPDPMVFIKQAAIVLLFFFAQTGLSKAQSAYQGGKGDGYGYATTEQQSTGRQRERRQPELTVFPHPVIQGRKATVHIGEPFNYQVTYQLFDGSGRLVNSQRTNMHGQTFELAFPKALPSGRYWLRIKSADKRWQRQLILLKE